MAKVRLIYIGKPKFPFVDEGCRLFFNRIKHYYSLEEVCLKPKYSSNQKAAQLSTEAKELSKYLTKDTYTILLDEKGKSYTSTEYASKLEKWIEQPKTIQFIIGGAFGFDQSVYTASAEKLSLSSMTHSHQLIRLIFLEQFYRACTIIAGEKYHNP